ncbi:helix-turn-helix domain-containing protein [Paenibacillus aurantiacus]|uniref:Helix-turn-helix domain-containing protein n=1 Tax=Paenibacillus aurantiacus TaxID=1936118 RepID=A0ABV5KL47_9BACL
MTNDELFENVQRAQYGDRPAMQSIIEAYYPLIRKQIRALAPTESKEFEQSIIEKIVRAVHNYDLNALPDFITFCHLDPLE